MRSPFESLSLRVVVTEPINSVSQVSKEQIPPQRGQYFVCRSLQGRSLWGIENSLHWQLDVTLREDDCRVRKGHSDASLSVNRRLALSMRKNDKTEKLGIRNKRMLAAWDTDYLANVPFG